MDRACRRIGLDPAGAHRMRVGENMLFQLASAPVIVRVARGPGHWDDAVKEVAVADWLAAQRFPAARTYIAADRAQPIDIEGYPVTFWQQILGRAGGLGDAGALGGLLKRLHQLGRPSGFRLPTVEGFGHVPERLAASPVSAADKDFMRRRVAELQHDLHRLEFRLPEVAVHGDAHIANLMIEPSGSAVLIDLEAFAWGHAEWDLAKTAAEAAMGMHEEGGYEAFVAAYGYDVTSWSGWSVLKAVMQLKMVTWLAQNVGQAPRIKAEYEKRIQTIRTGVLSEPWRGL